MENEQKRHVTLPELDLRKAGVPSPHFLPPSPAVSCRNPASMVADFIHPTVDLSDKTQETQLNLSFR